MIGRGPSRHRLGTAGDDGQADGSRAPPSRRRRRLRTSSGGRGAAADPLELARNLDDSLFCGNRSHGAKIAAIEEAHFRRCGADDAAIELIEERFGIADRAGAAASGAKTSERGFVNFFRHFAKAEEGGLFVVDDAEGTVRSAKHGLVAPADGEPYDVDCAAAIYENGPAGDPTAAQTSKVEMPTDKIKRTPPR